MVVATFYGKWPTLLLLLLFVMLVGLCLGKINSEQSLDYSTFLHILSHSVTSLDVLLKRFIITQLTKIVHFPNSRF